jgi:biopolymer transport protein ExbB/TolQ
MTFIAGLCIGGIAAIFVYRNNVKKISKYADKIDQLYKEIDDLTK